MKKIIVVGLTFLWCSSSFAQVSDSSALFKTMQHMDSLLFETGFNKCQVSVYDNIVSDDLEFYHDVGGITSGKAAFKASIQNNICNNSDKPKRKLVEGSMKVYPLYKNQQLYGAIQEGDHDFFILSNGQYKKSGTAKFTELWLLENNEWKLKRVLSFNHKATQ
ncbi:MAG: nuclear transport factor 2 family protein [Niabella sp.]|nr:nuclear transport factor 2 family protein [Niabella sp.]